MVRTKGMSRAVYSGLFLSVTTSLFSIAPTVEEKELLRIARERHHNGIKEIIADVKYGWSVVEYFHKGVALNKRVNKVLAECWQRAYGRDDSSYSTKIKERDLTKIFEQFLIEMQPNIIYYEKQTALTKFKHDAYYFGRESQREFRHTIQKAQRIIVKHLKEYIPLKMRQEYENSTERVFKDGIRFLLYVILKKYNKGFNRHEVKFINAKIEMFVNEMGREYPYISVAAFESWACSLLQDLLFAECVVCMNHRADRYMTCCKTKNICRKCYARVSACPLCRAPKRTRS